MVPPGGKPFNVVNTVENFQTSITSQRKMANMAKSVDATAVMSSHPEFDDAVDGIRMLSGRKRGKTYAFEPGADAAGRYFEIPEGRRKGGAVEAETIKALPL